MSCFHAVINLFVTSKVCACLMTSAQNMRVLFKSRSVLVHNSIQSTVLPKEKLVLKLMGVMHYVCLLRWHSQCGALFDIMRGMVIHAFVRVCVRFRACAQ